MIKHNTFRFLVLIVIISLNISGCKSRSAQNAEPGKSESAQNKTIPSEKTEAAVPEKVIFFIENSGSMLGYIRKANEFKNSLIGLTYLPAFDMVEKSFYFINGTSDPAKNSKIYIKYIGNDPQILKNQLNQTSFNTGNVGFSDLTEMFEIALDSAKGDQICVLVSDCIYDVGSEDDPGTALQIETHKTQQAFRNRLENEDIQTLIIKASSKFDGSYYYASKKGSKNLINAERPFYVIFFGKSELLTRMLTEQNIGSKIEGPYETARFFVNDEKNIPFQITPSLNRIGGFKLNFKDNHQLNDANPFKGAFQFAIAADFSSLPFSGSYLTSVSNYECLSSNFMVNKVEKISKKIPGIEGTHIITVFTDKNPLGELEIVLKNVTPVWIAETDTDNEEQIDSSHTFGFKSLMDAISEAYIYENNKNNGSNPATFKIIITK